MRYCSWLSRSAFSISRRLPSICARCFFAFPRTPIWLIAAAGAERAEFVLLPLGRMTGGRHWQVAAYRGCERHRIEWLGQYALGAERDEVLDLGRLRPGGQEHDRNFGCPRI